MPLWKQRLFARLQAPEGDGGGGGGSAPPQITPEVQKIIDAAVESAVTGLKAKNGELIGDTKKLKEQLQQCEGIDPVKVKAILSRFANDEEAKLIAEGKIDEVLQKRTERLRADLEGKLTKAQQDAEAASKRALAFQGRVLDDAIRAAAAKAGLHQHAIDDALFRARSMFSLDESGQAVQLGEDGKPVLGKDGKSPFTPLEWLEGMKEKAPHWYPATASGGGAGGGGGGGSGGAVKKAQEMTAQEKASFIGTNGLDKWNEKVQADYAIKAK